MGSSIEDAKKLGEQLSAAKATAKAIAEQQAQLLLLQQQEAALKQQILKKEQEALDKDKPAAA